MTLNFWVNQKSCGTHQLTISRLEPNVEVGRQTVQDIKTLNQDLLTLFGTDTATARGTLDHEGDRISGPAHHIAAGLLGWYIDDPRSTVTLQNLDDETLGIVGALAQVSGTADRLRKSAAYVQENPSTPLNWEMSTSGNQVLGIAFSKSTIADGDELAQRLELARHACIARDTTAKAWADTLTFLELLERLVPSTLLVMIVVNTPTHLLQE